MPAAAFNRAAGDPSLFILATTKNAGGSLGVLTTGMSNMRAVLVRRLALAATALAALAVTSARAQMIRLDAIPLALAHRDHEPFGRSTSLAPAGPLWIKWRGFEAGLAKDSAAIAQCQEEPGTCSPAARRLVAVIEEARRLDGRHQLAVVNRAVNLAVAYASDESQHGAGDVWSSPLTTFSTARGDCEDYAIAKFFALRAAGVPTENLRLLIAHNRSDGNAHAVLAARQDERWLILDNRRMALVEDESVRDLSPLFALDATGVQQFGATTTTVAARPLPTTPALSNVSAGISGTLPILL
jgi:predicted transglutaminase-like cysteine proteinase